MSGAPVASMTSMPWSTGGPDGPSAPLQPTRQASTTPGKARRKVLPFAVMWFPCPYSPVRGGTFRENPTSQGSPEGAAGLRRSS